jgi:hypothetical protein
MKRLLLTLSASCMALFAFAGPTPAKAQVLCNWGWDSYGRCYQAYTVMRPVTVMQPVAVQPVVATVPYYTTAYRRTMVPYTYTAVGYRPALEPYTRVAYARTTTAYAYVPHRRRAWVYER